jgi:CHRD domain/PEP-CTERM motif
MKTLAAVVATLLMLAAAPSAQAAIITFHVDLDGASETPPVVTPGSGTGTVVVDTVSLTMALNLSFSGLLGNTTASHIHCCNVPSVTSPVATQVPTFAGFPLGATSGSYTNTFDMTLASSYNPTFITNNGGTTATAFAALLAGMLDGRAYWNVHTNRFPGGEIRGALQVPEPSSLLLLGVAFVVLASRRRLAAR